MRFDRLLAWAAVALGLLLGVVILAAIVIPRPIPTDQAPRPITAPRSIP